MVPRVWTRSIFGDGKKQMTKKFRPPPKPAQPDGAPSAQPTAGSGGPWLVLGVCVVLAAITFAVFGQTLKHGFVNYDDNRYVYENSTVTNGLTHAGVAQAFTHGSLANWDPLTTISHMLDCQLHGLQPGWHHLTDVLLHAASVVLLFLALRKMTGALWRSAFVAAVFAVHPLHVESVAWVSERKDTLSGLFFMLTLWAYAYYAKNPPKIWRYLLVMVFFACGLMSKSMLVTLPFVLLLLDYWPLGRFDELQGTDKDALAVLRSRVVLEKLPLLALMVGSCVVAVVMQGRAIKSFDEYPFGLRLANAVVSVAIYIWQMFFPARLAVFYPYPAHGLPGMEVGIAVLALAGISAAAWHWRRTRPYLLTGWLWYLGMLMPVMGLIQIGAQAHADRYTYLPQIGLYVALTWLAAGVGAGWPHRRLALGGVACAVVAALGVAAFAQTTYWQDSESLWKHTLACTTDNVIAHNNLGSFEYQHQQTDAAVADFQQAVAIRPDFADARCNLGSALLQQGRVDEAIVEFQKAVEIQPLNPNYSGDLGTALLQKGRLDEAISAFRSSLAIQPNSYDVHNNLGFALYRAGQMDEAIAQFLRTLELKPDCQPAQKSLAGMAWILAASPDASLRNGPKAVELAEEAYKLSGGGDPILASVLAGAYAEAGRFPEAVAAAHRALDLATAQSNAQLATAVQDQLNYYEARRPFRDPALQGVATRGAR
jgi:tetratricopeptide (TPR) repeat protein